MRSDHIVALGNEDTIVMKHIYARFYSAVKAACRPIILRLTREDEFLTAFVRQGLVAYFKMGCAAAGQRLRRYRAGVGEAEPACSSL